MNLKAKVYNICVLLVTTYGFGNHDPDKDEHL